MLRVILIISVTTLFQIVSSMTLTNDAVSGKILHRERRAMVFPIGTVLQVGLHLAGYCKKGSPCDFLGLTGCGYKKKFYINWN
jgi:hypothetical protein